MGIVKGIAGLPSAQASDGITPASTYALARTSLSMVDEGGLVQAPGCPLLRRRGNLLVPNDTPEEILTRSSYLCPRLFAGADGTAMAAEVDPFCGGTWTPTAGTTTVHDGEGPDGMSRILRLGSTTARIEGSGALLNLARHASSVWVFTSFKRTVNYSGGVTFLGVRAPNDSFLVLWQHNSTATYLGGRTRAADAYADINTNKPGVDLDVWRTLVGSLDYEVGRVRTAYPEGSRSALESSNALDGVAEASEDVAALEVIIGARPGKNSPRGDLAGQLVISVPEGTTLTDTQLYNLWSWFEFETGART